MFPGFLWIWSVEVNPLLEGLPSPMTYQKKTFSENLFFAAVVGSIEIEGNFAKIGLTL